MRAGHGPTFWKFEHQREGRLIWASGLGDLDLLIGSPEYLEAIGDQPWESNALADEGEQQILDVYFRGASPPASLYVGLVAGSPSDTTTLATMTEVSGTGYARIALARNSTDWPTLALNSGDYQVVSLAKTFTAGGTWTGATNAFLTDASSGTSGKFVAYTPLSATRTLVNTDTLAVTHTIKLA
jgi:hypothetical protein